MLITVVPNLGTKVVLSVSCDVTQLGLSTQNFREGIKTFQNAFFTVLIKSDRIYAFESLLCRISNKIRNYPVTSIAKMIFIKETKCGMDS